MVGKSLHFGFFILVIILFSFLWQGNFVDHKQVEHWSKETNANDEHIEVSELPMSIMHGWEKNQSHCQNGEIGNKGKTVS